MNMFRQLFSRRWWWTTLIVLAGIGLTIRLGFWQLDRYGQRQSVIHQVESMQALPVLDLNQRPLPTDLNTMEYRQVTVSGQYDFEHQEALRNQVRERMTGTDPGIALVTPLIMADGQAILVERGWIPLENTTPASWRQFDEPGTIDVTGIIRLSMVKAEIGNALVDPTLTPGQTRLDYWYFMNVGRIQEQIPYPILGVYIQQAPGTNLDTLPFRLMQKPDLDPGDNFSFALQWFFCAGLLFIGYPIWLKKQDNK
jgi:surfeit locus 1 family protein